MELSKWFEKGITIEAYEKELTAHKDNYEYIYKNFDMPDDKSLFQNIEKNYLKALVIAEPWCGHCMMDVPILKRIAEESNMEMSVCLRDTHPKLMDQYETSGKRVIPKFIFIDEDGTERAVWGPRAPQVTEIHNKILTGLPEKDSPQYEEKFKEKAAELSKRFSTDEALWNHVYNDIIKVIHTAV